MMHSLTIIFAITIISSAVMEGTTTAIDRKASRDGSLAWRALNLWSTPHSSIYRFPSWVAEEWDEQILPKFGSTAVVYHASDNLPEVRTMATFREPTNIAMDRKGSRRTLDEFYQSVLFGAGGGDDEPSGIFPRLFPDAKFSDVEERNALIGAYYRNQQAGVCHGYENISASSSSQRFRTNLEGAYRFTNKNYRMPQIAAYAKTPMRYVFRGASVSNEEGVHVLSLVGAGFDMWQQPDYQYYFDKTTQDIRSERQDEFYRERQIAFVISLQCAHDHRLDRVEFVPVGAGAFAGDWRNSQTVLRVLERAWKSDEVQAYKLSLEKLSGKTIYFSIRTDPPFSHNNGLGDGLPSFYAESAWTGEGHWNNWKDAIERTLFINAWDPWSLVGNGNEMDSSVDGMYGRQSALALLCWPITNPHLQYRRIEF